MINYYKDTDIYQLTMPRGCTAFTDTSVINQTGSKGESLYKRTMMDYRRIFFNNCVREIKCSKTTIAFDEDMAIEVANRVNGTYVKADWYYLITLKEEKKDEYRSKYKRLS